MQFVFKHNDECAVEKLPFKAAPGLSVHLKCLLVSVPLRPPRFPDVRPGTEDMPAAGAFIQPLLPGHFTPVSELRNGGA